MIKIIAIISSFLFVFPERELSCLPGVVSRMHHETLRGFLLRLTLPGGGASGQVGTASGQGCGALAVLRGLEPRLLHQLCDQYSHARYHALPFTRHNLTITHSIMLRVMQW